MVDWKLDLKRFESHNSFQKKEKEKVTKHNFLTSSNSRKYYTELKETKQSKPLDKWVKIEVSRDR